MVVLNKIGIVRSKLNDIIGEVRNIMISLNIDIVLILGNISTYFAARGSNCISINTWLIQFSVSSYLLILYLILYLLNNIKLKYRIHYVVHIIVVGIFVIYFLVWNCIGFFILFNMDCSDQFIGGITLSIVLIESLYIPTIVTGILIIKIFSDFKNILPYS